MTTQNKLDWPYKTPGIPEEYFSRGKVPMTKEEVRVIALAKGRITPFSTIWDIGAGTGSIAIESALIASRGKVYAVERKAEAIKLIIENKEKFQLENIDIIQGEAPRGLELLPDPDIVFLGGTGGQLEEILDIVYDRLKPGGRIVIMSVTIETLGLCANYFKNSGFKDPEYIQVSIAKTQTYGQYHLWQGQNPVTMIVAHKNS